jgi:hypothetical protein
MPVNKYVCYCLTEQNFVTTWSDTAPTVCPNNNTHPIDPNTIGITETMNNQTVYIAGKDSGKTNGYYLIHGKITDITVDPITIADTIFKTPSCIFGLTFISSLNQKGDTLDIIVNPDTAVGIITQAANIGATTLNVSPTVIQYITHGMYVSLYDGVNKNDCGIVLSVDSDNSTITVETALTNNFAIGSDILLNLYVAKNYPIGDPWKYEIGYGTLGGKPVPANTIFRLVYYNNSGVAKTFSYSYEFTY